jgi:transglutaminase-like putative cysteine protease
LEAYFPGAGWVEFDPTNGIIGSERLIRVAVARDPEQAMPIKGSFTGAAGVQVSTEIHVQVKSVAAHPALAPPAASRPGPQPPTPPSAAQVAGLLPLTQS